MRKMGNPAVMFDAIPGYPKGHRVIANILTSLPRINARCVGIRLMVGIPQPAAYKPIFRPNNGDLPAYYSMLKFAPS